MAVPPRSTPATIVRAVAFGVLIFYLLSDYQHAKPGPTSVDFDQPGLPAPPNRVYDQGTSGRSSIWESLAGRSLKKSSPAGVWLHCSRSTPQQRRSKARRIRQRFPSALARSYPFLLG